jgi:hypothetical protein
VFGSGDSKSVLVFEEAKKQCCKRNRLRGFIHNENNGMPGKSIRGKRSIPFSSSTYTPHISKILALNLFNFKHSEFVVTLFEVFEGFPVDHDFATRQATTGFSYIITDNGS